MKKVMLFFLLQLLISCSVPPLTNEYPCPDGNCDAVFKIDTQQNPGSYQDQDGVWHIKYSGLNYFRIKGTTDELTPQYVLNGVPKLETRYDSNYFYILGQTTWTYPVYSYLGLFLNNNLNTAIPVGNLTLTLPQIVDETSVSNVAGYEINKHFNFDHPAAQTMLGSYSKYTYKPQQQMVFFPDMIGDSADIYIQVFWNNDFNGESVKKEYKLSVIFEN